MKAYSPKIRLLFSVAVLVFVSACATSQGVLVDVTVPPQVNLKLLSEDIKTVNMKSLDGDKSCAGPLKSKIDELITNAEVFKKEIGGFEESGSTAIDIKGKVTACNIDMGYGTISASFSLVYNGQEWKTFNITKDTNRPGATAAEVREVVVDKVAKMLVLKFIPTKQQELRVFKPLGPDDTGVQAAMNSNWSMAIDSWGKKLKKTPTDHAMLYNRGVAYEARGDLKKAIADYQKALEIAKKDELYVQALARAQNALKALEEKDKMKAE